MNMWMKVKKGRTWCFRSPMTEGRSRTPGMPYNDKEQPTLTFVARQKGEAWNRPFASRLRTFDGKGNRADFFRYFSGGGE